MQLITEKERMENSWVNSKTPKERRGVLLAESSSGCRSSVTLKPSTVDQPQGAGGSSDWMLAWDS